MKDTRTKDELYELYKSELERKDKMIEKLRAENELLLKAAVKRRFDELEE